MILDKTLKALSAVFIALLIVSVTLLIIRQIVQLAGGGGIRDIDSVC